MDEFVTESSANLEAENAEAPPSWSTTRRAMSVDDADDGAERDPAEEATTYTNNLETTEFGPGAQIGLKVARD